MLLGVDANDDGEIDYEEFIDMMIGGQDTPSKMAPPV